jgi:transglutaminase-like putative cysteine protease
VRYRVEHRTTYTYAQPVSVCHNLFHLRPRACAAQQNDATTLTIDPLPAVLIERDDFHGNPTTFAIVQQLHHTLDITAVTFVERAPIPAPASTDGAAWETVRDQVRSARDPAGLARYQLTFPSPMVRGSAALRDYAAPSFPAGRPALAAAIELSSRLHRELTYVPGATTVETTPEDTLASGQGVCQDFSHVLVGCLRSFGVPARYVSGYLMTTPDPARPADALVGADASHAWVAVWTPEAGWVDLDPTNDMLPSDRHVTVAWGRDYGDVCPVKGVILGGGSHTIDVAVAVTPTTG